MYVGEDQVIDVVMTPADSGITCDHKTMVTGSSQTVSSIIFARMVDAGLIDYPMPISQYWPNFAQNGKDKLTVADLMKHESGIQKLPE